MGWIKYFKKAKIFRLLFFFFLGGHLMIKNRITSFLFYSMVLAFVANVAPAAGGGEWRVYHREANGDVYFFDVSRVGGTSSVNAVWVRIQYKTSVMGASSYQSLLEVDCSERTERILQRTFFSDRHWEKPAMSTDMKEKPKRPIVEGSAAERLFGILCEQ